MGTVSLPDNSTMVQTWDGVSLGELTSIHPKFFFTLQTIIIYFKSSVNSFFYLQEIPRF